MTTYPCIQMYPKAAENLKVDRAVFQKDSIWKPGSKGLITVTFGLQQCSGCSPDAAWSLIGKFCPEGNPGMNLGFIDPPLS